jgi:hypothetical protein
VKLPNAEHADVSHDKVVNYLLNLLHPDGASKAKFFLACGFVLERWTDLADALRNLAIENEAASETKSEHGRKYVIEGILKTPSGAPVKVREIWIIDAGTIVPRLVTAYPCR